MRALLLPLVVACSTPPRSAPGPLPLSPLPARTATPASTFVDDVIVVEASGIANHHDAPIRTLRRIVGARHGHVEVTTGFGEVRLIVTRVVSGKLFDPEYAKRPDGANGLEVVLVDEAAHFATNDDRDYKGTWHLTQLADGTLVAASLADTPFTSSEPWHTWVATTRADLRAPTLERRKDGLRALIERHSYELVPDLIAMLDDNRRIADSETTVADIAEDILNGCAGAIGEDPRLERSIEEWTKLWAERFTQVEPLPVIAPSTATERARLFAHENLPEIAVASGGIVVATDDNTIDAKDAGIFVTTGAQRIPITREQFQFLQVAGAGMVWADLQTQRWHFATTAGKSVALTPQITKAKLAAIATAGDGFLVLGADTTRHVHAVELDADGNRRRTAKLVLPALAGKDASHIFVAPSADGWLATVATDKGLFAIAIDGALRVRSAAKLFEGVLGASIAVGRDRAFAAWNIGSEISTRVIDLDGNPVAEAVMTGDAVWDLSKPVALDDGFAIAWTEAGRELHVGRFDRAGALVSNVVVQDRHVAPFTGLHLARDQAALLVTFLDESRYPYTVVTRRL